MTDWKDHITIDSNILLGKSIINDTRISVELIMDRLADGLTMEQIRECYPRIAREDILAAIALVTEVFREEDDIPKRKVGAGGGVGDCMTGNTRGDATLDYKAV